LTTVPSMKAMLEPRMVAARTHGSAARLHSASAALDLMAPSSQGDMKMLAMAVNRKS
jgi:hypothetical protein